MCDAVSYQRARLDAAVAELTLLEDADAGIPSSSCLFNESSFNTDEVHRFQYFFDRYCEYAFINCVNQYNDYSQPLIVPDDFTNYHELSKQIFPFSACLI